MRHERKKESKFKVRIHVFGFVLTGMAWTWRFLWSWLGIPNVIPLEKLIFLFLLFIFLCTLCFAFTFLYYWFYLYNFQFFFSFFVLKRKLIEEELGTRKEYDQNIWKKLKMNPCILGLERLMLLERAWVIHSTWMAFYNLPQLQCIQHSLPAPEDTRYTVQM